MFCCLLRFYSWLLLVMEVVEEYDVHTPRTEVLFILRNTYFFTSFPMLPQAVQRSACTFIIIIIKLLVSIIAKKNNQQQQEFFFYYIRLLLQAPSSSLPLEKTRVLAPPSTLRKTTTETSMFETAVSEMAISKRNASKRRKSKHDKQGCPEG